jgi:Uma2 family endonuclease
MLLRVASIRSRRSSRAKADEAPADGYFSLCYARESRMTAVSSLPVTAEAYLAMERASTEKHEFHDGVLYAMSGGTRAHNLCAANIVRELGNALHERPCEAYGSDMKVRVGNDRRYVYPDVTAVCGPRFEDEHMDVLVNPEVVFEVLSDSTESYDRGDKFALYRGVPSILEVILVSQKAPRVERYLRQADGGWLLHEHGAGGHVPLDTLGCRLSVDEMYLKVFPSE